MYVFTEVFRTKDRALCDLFSAMRAGDRAGVQRGHEYRRGGAASVPSPLPRPSFGLAKLSALPVPCQELHDRGGAQT